MILTPTLGVNGPTSFQVEILPARVAYLIRTGSKSGFRRAIQEATTRWGGMTEPIIPVSKDGRIAAWWGQVIELSRVDALVDIDVGLANSTIVAGRMGLPAVPLSEIDRAGRPSVWTSHPANLPQGREGMPVIPAQNASLWQIVAAGDLTDAHENMMRSDAIPFRRDQFNDQIARAALSKGTLLDRTVVNFRENWSSGGFTDHPAVLWITPPNNLQECLFFWNLRSLQARTPSAAPIYILPRNEIQHWLGFPEQLQSTLIRPDGFAPDVTIDSLSIKDDDYLHQIADTLGLELSTEKLRMGNFFARSLRSRPFTYQLRLDMQNWVVFDRRYGETTIADGYAVNGEIKLKFTSPVQFSRLGQTKMRFRGESLDALPKSAPIAEMIVNNGSWEDGALRISILTDTNYRLPLRIPTLSESVSVLLKSATQNYALSDKGKIGDALLNTGTSHELLLPGIYQTIIELTTPRSAQLLKELKAMRENGHHDADLADLASRWGGRSARRYRDATNLPKKGGAEQHPVELLCAAGWAERGLEIRCHRCGTTSFALLQSVSSQAICPGCGSHESFTSEKHGLKVFYRLDTFIDQASDQGVIPHIIVAEVFKKRDPRTFILPGVDVVLKDDTKTEIDIFGIHAGQIISGEVKTSSTEFTHDQIKRDLHNSKNIGAAIHVMASMSDFTEEQILYAQTRATKLDVKLEILAPLDLQPS